MMNPIHTSIKFMRVPCSLKRGFTMAVRTCASSSNKGKKPQPIAGRLRPFVIFGAGLYLGLAFFKGDDSKKRDGSAYLKD
mmetsp:Transcript_16161/g.23623  ORF Transcript_16161/g.23623 Transcript_16161/m.23623 type:complete len:80 (-) Transcript_16161:13-252(-)